LQLRLHLQLQLLLLLLLSQLPVVPTFNTCKKSRVIPTEATHSLIVSGAVEGSPHFAFCPSYCATRQGDAVVHPLNPFVAHSVDLS